jgi:hypothetical protein
MGGKERVRVKTDEARSMNTEAWDRPGDIYPIILTSTTL